MGGYVRRIDVLKMRVGGSYCENAKRSWGGAVRVNVHKELKLL